jgi:hypothetical protein
MFNLDLDTKNTLPFLAYSDPLEYQNLIEQKRRTTASFKRISIRPEIDEIFNLLGTHKKYAVNFRKANIGDWVTKTAGWNDSRFPTTSFMPIDFMNVLLGTYGSGTAIGLSEMHQDKVATIRIDYDFGVYSGDAAVGLAREIQDKLGSIGLDVLFLCTGNRGIQALIPLPSPLPFHNAKALWKRLRNYLTTDLAKLDRCSLENFLRLPLGIHASSNNLSLFFSPDTESYISIHDQLSQYRNSWQWRFPIHIPDALTCETFQLQVETGFTFVPTPAVAIVVKQSTSKIPSGDSWANIVWNKGGSLQPGQWQSYLFDDHALHASYLLHGNDACNKLEELARQVPVDKPSDVADRIKRVRSLWQSFNPVRPPKDSSEILALMLTTTISNETKDEADALFTHIQNRKTSKTRWINSHAREYILAVVHGLNCADGFKLTITLDELITYLRESGVSQMSRRTLVRIIGKSTQQPPDIGVGWGLDVTTPLQNELAVFLHDSGEKQMVGSTPGSFRRIPGLKRTLLADAGGLNP